MSLTWTKILESASSREQGANAEVMVPLDEHTTVGCLTTFSFIIHTFLCKKPKQLLFVFIVSKKAVQLPGILVEDETRRRVPQPLFSLVAFFKWFDLYTSHKISI